MCPLLDWTFLLLSVSDLVTDLESYLFGIIYLPYWRGDLTDDDL